MKQYKLRKNVDRKALLKNGFNSNYRKNIYVYKNMILLRMCIENNENGVPEFFYDVYDIDNGTLYYPYYAGVHYKNHVLDEVSKNVDEELKKLIKDNILRK